MKQLFILGMIFCSFFSARAQQDSVKRNQKLDQLFTIMNMSEVFSNGINTSAEQQMINVPSLAQHKDEVMSFFKKYMSWSVVKDDVAKIYSKFYTEKEIEELVGFYQTSAGKKTLRPDLQFQLQQEIVKMQTDKLQSHADELNKLVTGTTGTIIPPSDTAVPKK